MPQKRTQPTPKPGDIEYPLARGNVLLARRLEQQQQRAVYAKALLRKDNLRLAS